MKRLPLAAASLLSAAALVTLSACSSSSSSSADAPAASAPAASAPAADPSASAYATAITSTLQWCTDYLAITDAISAASVDQSGAQTAMVALSNFDKLWASAADLGLLTTDEADANRRAVDQYLVVTKLIAEGKAIDSQEVKDAQQALVTTTNADQALLDSSVGKVSAACAPLFAQRQSGAPSPAAS